MRGIKKYLLFVFLSLGVLFFSFIYLGQNLALAVEFELPGLGQNPSLPQYVGYIFNTVIQLAGIMAVFAIVLGGLYHLFSLGMGRMASEGKEWIKAGALGLLFLLCSWLIMDIINPNLISLKVSPILGIPLPTINFPNPLPKQPPTITFEEIPIGTLTESLLSRKINCYDFDSWGDPIDGDPLTLGWEPTFMEHDRVDCILKLSEAVEKKSKIFSDLSKEIKRLMDDCKCTADKCDLNCDPATGCFVVGGCPGGSCGGSCKGASCLNIIDKNCCPPGTKEKIEHGPIILKSCLEDPGKEYKGLDEFRTSLTIISPLIEEEIEINREKVIVIKKDEWKKLKLLEQLMYLKEKFSKMKEDLKTDLDNLKNAEEKMGKCYLVKSHKEFLKIVESTDKKDTTVVVQKIFKDPATNKYVDPSKYCKGFSWSNATIFNACQKICSPGANPISFKSLKNCNDNDTNCIKSSYYKCGANAGFTDFQGCLVKFNGNCKKSCEKEYPNCPPLEECKRLCDEDSNLLSSNEDCYVNFQVSYGCAKKYATFEDFKRCVQSSTCSYCTDQYAGYPDCLKEPIKESDLFSSLYFYQNPTRQKDYLSSFFVTKPGKTPAPSLYPESSKCPFFSRCPQCPCDDKKCANTEKEKKRLICGGECSESSYDGDPLTFYCRVGWVAEAYSDTETKSAGSPEDSEGLTEGDIKELDSTDDPLTDDERKELLQGAELKTPVLAETMYCPKEKEIPVGQTVDDAEYWAKELLRLTEEFTETIENMVQYIKKIGEEKNYCQCDSKCNSSEKICTSDCIYFQTLITDPETGNRYWACWCNLTPCAGNPCLKMINLLMGKTAFEKCPENTKFCGVPCYYSKKEENCSNKCENGKFGLKEILEEMKKFVDKRSDILKELVYSRKKMDECSATSGIFKGETRSVNCTIMKDYNFDPISIWKTIINKKSLRGYCYGQWVGMISGTGPLMDNWGCCEVRIRQ